jgi:hypothetical protein
MKEEIFYQRDGGSLLMTELPYLSRWLPHMSSSSMKEVTQGKQLLRQLWLRIFMSPSSPAYIRQYMKDAVSVPEKI